MENHSLTRRSFVRVSALFAAGTALSASSRAKSAGSNGDIRIGVVGLRNFGGRHIREFRAVKGVRIVAICDVDSAVLERTAAGLKKDGVDVSTFSDYRKMLESREIDAVSLATPNHQHALQGIWGCQAGKDVYVEKPVSHNIWEGRQLAAAASRYDRVVQAGTQNRSRAAIAEAIDWVNSGEIGKIVVAHGLCYKRRKSIGLTQGPQPVPDTVNYDLWSGPAPLTPLRREKLHYDWHWQWATGNGDLGNQGCHQIDIGRWFLGDPGIPPRTLSIGGRFGYEDDGETPNTQIALYDYPIAPFVFEVRGLPARAGTEEMDEYQGCSIGVVVRCEAGSVVVANRTVTAFDPDQRIIREFTGEGRPAKGHYENFIAAVRSRDSSHLTAPIDLGHVSSALSHTANISQRLAKRVTVAQARRNLEGGPAYADAFDRMVKHLEANQLDLKKLRLGLGPELVFDAEAERFVDNEKANALLTRDYRPPFVVPDIA